MRVIAKRPLVEFWKSHPEAEKPLRNWLTICRTTNFENFAQLKQTFRTVDKVGKFVVFDIGGNKFRLIAPVATSNSSACGRVKLLHPGWRDEGTLVGYEALGKHG